MSDNELSVAGLGNLPEMTVARLPDFAREYVRCGNVVTAIQRARVQNSMYRIAVWGDRLLADPGVRAMIADAQAELDAEPKRPKEYTRESIADDFQEVFERALENEEFSPAVSAKAKQAELLGLMEKNVRLTVTTNVAEMSMEDLERELARLTDEGVITLDANDVSVTYGIGGTSS